MEDEPKALTDSVHRHRLRTSSLQRTGDTQMEDRRFEGVAEDIARRICVEYEGEACKGRKRLCIRYARVRVANFISKNYERQYSCGLEILRVHLKSGRNFRWRRCQSLPSLLLGDVAHDSNGVYIQFTDEFHADGTQYSIYTPFLRFKAPNAPPKASEISL